MENDDRLHNQPEITGWQELKCRCSPKLIWQEGNKDTERYLARYKNHCIPDMKELLLGNRISIFKR